jgi:uncharacterized Zn finger protein
LSRWHDWNQFPTSKTREAKGGIRAQSKRGSFGQSWWSKRWIAVLEGFQLGSRLQRGRTYARRGQVLSISVDWGVVSASVQGSRLEPYQVRIHVKALSKADWRKLAAVVSGQAIFGAKLLGGEMPQDIETQFRSAGLSLFPEKMGDLQTDCSCPDWSNPCKHVAAVYYLLGEEFDRDPFLIFQLRGMGRDEFLGLLGQMAPAARSELALPPEPLPAEPSAFWSGGELPANLIGPVNPIAAGAALPRRLGNFPFWRGRLDFLESLEAAYVSAASHTASVIGE